MGMGKVSVEGYTRVVNGKPVRVKQYSQRRSLMDALMRAGRRPMAASGGEYAGGRSMPTSPAKRKAATKEMATELNAAKKRAVVAPERAKTQIAAANAPKPGAKAPAKDAKRGNIGKVSTSLSGGKMLSSSDPGDSRRYEVRNKDGKWQVRDVDTGQKWEKSSEAEAMDFANDLLGDRNLAKQAADSRGAKEAQHVEHAAKNRERLGDASEASAYRNPRRAWGDAVGEQLRAEETSRAEDLRRRKRDEDPPPEDEGSVDTPPEVLKALSGINPVGRPEGAGTLADPIDVGDDMERAVTLIAEGKHVRLRQVDEVSMVLDRLAKRVEHAKKLGDKAPNFNLCLITVPGTNLFCTESKGVPRAKMPQLSGQPTEGSRAWGLRNEKGEAHIEDAFRQALKDTGVKVELKTVLASHLKASQAELDGPKVAGMSKAMEAGKIPDAPIFVTKDGYIVDGHHRWASKVAIDLQDGVLGDVDMPVEEIDLDIGAVLDFANEFALAMGIKPKGLGAASEGVSSDSADPLVTDVADPLDAVAEAVAHLNEVIQKSKKGSTDRTSPTARLQAAATELTAARQGGSPANELVDKVTTDGGFTYDPRLSTYAEHGFAVAVPGNSKIISDADWSDRMTAVNEIDSYLAAHADEFDTNSRLHLGAWHDEEHAEVVLDLSEIFEDQREAIKAGADRNEQAIFDLDSFSEISTGGTGGREDYGRQ